MDVVANELIDDEPLVLEKTSLSKQESSSGGEPALVSLHTEPIPIKDQTFAQLPAAVGETGSTTLKTVPQQMGEPPLQGQPTAALVPLQAQPSQVEEPILQAQLSPIGELELPPLQALPLPNEYFDDPEVFQWDTIEGV